MQVQEFASWPYIACRSLGTRAGFAPYCDETSYRSRAPAGPVPAATSVWHKEKPLDIPQAMASFKDPFSTSGDLLVFMRALLRGELFDAPGTVKLMYTEWNRFGFSLSPVGPGWPIEYGLGMMRMLVTRSLTPFRPFPFEPWHSVIPALLFMLVLGPVEEFGWRGVALPLLQRRFVPLWSGLLLGAVWGVWHLPSFFIGGTPHAEWAFMAFLVGVISLSVIMTALFNSSRGSLILAVLFHFQINNPIWPDGKPWDFLLFSRVAVVIVILNRGKMLTKKTSVTEVLMPGDEEVQN